MSLPLEGLSAIVTGAARGLGRAEALELARLGAAVVVNDFGQSGRDGSGDASAGPAEEVAAEIRTTGGRAVAHTGDVADHQQARELVELAVAEFGSWTSSSTTRASCATGWSSPCPRTSGTP